MTDQTVQTSTTAKDPTWVVTAQLAEPAYPSLDAGDSVTVILRAPSAEAAERRVPNYLDAALTHVSARRLGELLTVGDLTEADLSPALTARRGQARAAGRAAR